MEHDTRETQRYDGTNIDFACGKLAKTPALIRSLRDDEQVRSQ